jgi:hypothetical protein
MSPWWSFLTSLVAVGLLIWILQRLVFKRWAKEMLEEFMAQFPGVCPICSYHNHGLMSGHDIELQPEPHDCHGLRSLAIFGTRNEDQTA